MKYRYSLLMVIFFLFQTTCLFSESELIFEEIDTGMMFNRNLIKDGRGTVNYKITYKDPNSSIKTNQGIIEWIILGNRIKVIDQKEILNIKHEIINSYDIRCWNGEYQVYRTFLESQGPETYWIEKANPNSRQFLPFHPFEHGLSFALMDLKEFINDMKENDGRLIFLGTETEDAEKFYILERLFGNASDTDRMKFWINPRKGYTIAKSITTINDNAPYMIDEYEIFEYPLSNLSYSIWFPRKRSTKIFDSDGYRLLEEREYIFNDIKFNTGLTINDVDIQLKPGVHIIDRRFDKDSRFGIDKPIYIHDIVIGNFLPVSPPRVGEITIYPKPGEIGGVTTKTPSTRRTNLISYLSPKNLFILGLTLILFGFILFIKHKKRG